jgi:hypothetical protein
MKKSIIFFRVIPVLATIGILMGCTSTNLKTNSGGEYNMIPLAGKDFNILGLVTVTATEKINVAPLYLAMEITGERVTFDLLLQEAKKLYPDLSDIINVRIDRVDQSRTSLFDFFTGYDRTIQYLGNAIAVKYTNAVEGSGPGAYGNLPSGGDFSISPGSRGGFLRLFGN